MQKNFLDLTIPSHQYAIFEHACAGWLPFSAPPPFYFACHLPCVALPRKAESLLLYVLPFSLEFTVKTMRGPQSRNSVIDSCVTLAKKD